MAHTSILQRSYLPQTILTSTKHSPKKYLKLLILLLNKIRQALYFEIKYGRRVGSFKIHKAHYKRVGQLSLVEALN